MRYFGPETESVQPYYHQCPTAEDFYVLIVLYGTQNQHLKGLDPFLIFFLDNNILGISLSPLLVSYGICYFVVGT